MSPIQARFHHQRGAFTLDVEFEIPAVGVTAIFGPSGSGKSTLLRCIAGLERPHVGFFSINKTPWQDSSRAFFLPPHERPVGVVFQDPLLFPHLSVRENLEYGLTRISPKEARITLDQSIVWLGLDSLLHRKPENLSGGEQRRVAIARALLVSPRLLLMDEPLTGLDTPAKSEILAHLTRLHEELALPILYVSHALDEVAQLADHLLMIRSGKLTASEPFLDAASRIEGPLADLDDAGAVIEAEVAAYDEPFNLARLDFPGGSLWVPRAGLTKGTRLRVRIPARDVSLALDPPSRSSILNIIAGEITGAMEHGTAQCLVRIRAGETHLLARITRRSATQLAICPGMKVYAQIKSVALLRPN